MSAQPASPQTLQLQDIHLPPEPGFWPPAPGWWLVAAILLLAIVFAGRKWFHYLQRRRAQRRIEAELAWLRREFDRGEIQQAIIDTNIFLRKMALARFPETDVAGLTGRDWLEFLDRSGKTRDFTDGPGAILAEGPYRRAIDQTVDGAALLRSVEHWLKTVERSAGGPGARR